MEEVAKWYIATTIIGNEDVVYKNIEDKIRAYGLNDLVSEIKLLKSREITIWIFDNKNNPPPKSMRNTKSITWETLPGNRYKKTRIREVNRFPGYIYIKMIMTQEAWYAIRNTYGITGFVGSSGKGAQPIPMSDEEVALLFDMSNTQDIINAPDGYDISNDNFDQNIVEEVKPFKETTKTKESKVEFLETPKIISVHNKPFIVTHDDFYDSKKNNLVEEIKEDTTNEEESMESIFLDNNETTFEKKVETNTHNNSLKTGMQIMIINGGLKDTLGLIQSIDNDANKVEVEVEILGQKNKVWVSIDDISVDY